MLPLDLLLEEPTQHDQVEPASFDVETGRINPNQPGPRMRTVYLRGNRVTPGADDEGEVDTSFEVRGQFIPCACCGERGRFGRSTVQDHQTKGDQPFQALVAKQIQIQPPNAVEATRFAPLRGRKVLVFSDSRQVAARLAPHLQMYSVRRLASAFDRVGISSASRQHASEPAFELGRPVSRSFARFEEARRSSTPRTEGGRELRG